MIFAGVWMFFHWIQPFLNFLCWRWCLKSIRDFLQTVEKHRSWLKQIHGFQLIRPMSAVFQFELVEFRRILFEGLKQSFLVARNVAQHHKTDCPNLISLIDLNEFGPLLLKTGEDLRQTTNNFDQSSIDSMLKLYELQVEELLSLVEMKRPQSLILFVQFQRSLIETIRRLEKAKGRCGSTNSIRIETSRQRLALPYFLLRTSVDQIYEMNEKETINEENLKKIVADLKTVIFSLESFISRATTTKICSTNNEDEVLTTPTTISSFHRFDDELSETLDEILVGETGEQDVNIPTASTIDDEQQFLREQTRCLFVELEKAIEGKKQEWNEREQKILGVQPASVEEKVVVAVERFLPVAQPTSVLDELKRSFVLNRTTINSSEDIFGETDDENSISD